MIEFKRVTDAEENSIIVTGSEGYIKVVGTADFVVRFIKDLCENSKEFQSELQQAVRGETVESVAAKLRDGGFNEEIIQDFLEK